LHTCTHLTGITLIMCERYTGLRWVLYILYSRDSWVVVKKNEFEE
jgi:hypothetical protein